MEVNPNGQEDAPAIGRLHVITDFYLQQEHSHMELAQQAIRGGADVIQFRQKSGNIRNKLVGAESTQEVCEDGDVTLLINDHVDIAQAVGAAGVHLGREDFPVAAARSILGPNAIIGATARSPEHALEAYEDGASYIGFGPVFPTQSKYDRTSVKGLNLLAETCEAVPLPVIAIAGITAERVQSVLDAGAHGVAVLSAVALADDPEEATTDLREAIDGAVPSS